MGVHLLIDNGVDGQALLEITEKQLERLIGHLKKEMILSKAIEALKNACSAEVEEDPRPVQPTSPRPGPSHKPDVPEAQPMEEETDSDHNDIVNPDDLGTYK